MTAEELQNAIRGLVEDAVNFNIGILAPARAKATEYYLGQPFGNEEEGRSQFINTVVRDNIRGVTPDIMRVIFGPERVLELEPRNKNQIEQAEQASDWMQYVFAEKNPGFMNTLAVFNDGMIRKLGIFKWGWDETSSEENYTIDDIAESKLALILTDPGVELLRLEVNKQGSPAVTAPVPQQQPNPGAPQDPSIAGNIAPPQQAVIQPATETTYNAELRHTNVEGVARHWAIPPEEFIYNREARDLETATLVGHVTEKTTSELLAMGVPMSVIEEHGGLDENIHESPDQVARSVVNDGDNTRDPDLGESNDKHTYGELYVLVDFDGDGKNELRRICTIGPNYEVIPGTNEPAKRRPFSVFCPVPEGHTMSGLSWADLLMDLQKFSSSVLRANADSLSLSMFPRTGYVEGKVNVTDLMNTEIGANIRMTEPGMIQPINHAYVGKESFPLLEYMQAIEERRTSQSAGSQGLDVDALQSTEQAAADKAFTAAQGQKELLLRIFVEQTLKPLFKGLYELYCENKPKATVQRIRGNWVEIDPRKWDVDMDVRVNVALGTSLIEKRIGALAALAAKQELIIQTFGPNNPAVKLGQYVKAIKKATELSGIPESDAYLSDVPPDWQPPQPQPQPDPKMLMVQVKQQEIAQSAQQHQTELQLKQRQHEQTMAMEQRKLDQALQIALAEIRAKVELGATEIEAKYKTQLAVENIRTGSQLDRQVAETERESLRQGQEALREDQITQRTHENKLIELGVEHEHNKELETIKAKNKPKAAPKKGE